MKLTNLRPVGQELLEDSEGYLNDLSEEELQIQGALLQFSHSYDASVSVPLQTRPYPSQISSISSSQSSYLPSSTASQSGSASSYIITAPISQSGAIPSTGPVVSSAGTNTLDYAMN